MSLKRDDVAVALTSADEDPKRSFILCGFDSADVAAAHLRFAADIRLITVTNADDLRRVIAVSAPAVVAIGPSAAHEILIAAVDALIDSSDSVTRVIVLSPRATSAHSSRIFFAGERMISTDDFLALTDAVLNPLAVPGNDLCRIDDFARLPPRIAKALLSTSQWLALQEDLANASELLAQEAANLAVGSRAHVVGYPRDAQTPHRGIVGFAALTRCAVLVDNADRALLYDRVVDDPAGAGDEHLAVVPVIAADGTCLSVIVVARMATQPSFSAAEVETLRALAVLAAPTLARLAAERHLHAMLRPTRARPEIELFRADALDSYTMANIDEGDPLRLSPRWVAWTYWPAVALLIAGLVYLAFGHINDYAAGPAIVRLSGDIAVSANRNGVAAAIPVQPGVRIKRGDLLVQFYNAPEAAELDRIDREFELLLIEHLRDPSEKTAEENLAGLRAQRSRAEQQLQQLDIRAPADGTVGDLRVRPGQSVTAGQVLLTIDRGTSHPTLVAMLPGEYRPLLTAGLPLRLELEGYPYSYQHVSVSTVGHEIVGVDQARRYLGPDIADAVPLKGAVVFAYAELETRFAADGRTYLFHDGMIGRAEVRIRSERIIEALIPALKRL